MRWIGHAAGALAAAYLLNFVAFFMLVYGLEYHASSIRHAVADVGVVILYPGTALSRDKIDPFVTGTFAWGLSYSPSSHSANARPADADSPNGTRHRLEIPSSPEISPSSGRLTPG